MNHSVILFLLALSITSCNSERSEKSKDLDYLVFGHFYGHCVGEECIETFKLTDDKLYEDADDGYRATTFNFQEVKGDHFNKVKDLKADFPEELLLEKEDVFGCPDCADGGGLVIQVSKDGKVHTWTLDQSKQNVPDYLHDFMDKINEKIALINK